MKKLTVFRLEKDLVKILKEKAKSEGITLTQLVRNALNQFIN